MGQGMGQFDETIQGRIEVSAVDPGITARAEALVPGLVGIEDYRWVPPASWTGDLCQPFHLVLRCVTTQDGRCFFSGARQFHPGEVRLCRGARYSGTDVRAIGPTAVFVLRAVANVGTPPG
jgi:hypothetical protein